MWIFWHIVEINSGLLKWSQIEKSGTSTHDTVSLTQVKAVQTQTRIKKDQEKYDHNYQTGITIIVVSCKGKLGFLLCHCWIC